MKVAQLLTVDKNNKDATQTGFDPKKIAQWGLELQRDDLRGMGAYFGSGSLAAPGSKTVTIPDAWKAAWKYYYDAIWTDHVSLTGPQFESKDINPKDYPFFNGYTAMSENFLWSTYGVADAGDDWDLAAIPSYNGQTTAAFNADTFRILKGSKHPDEAFQVLTYLLGDAAPDLLKAYGGFPARTADQAAGIAALQSQFKNTVDWQVAIDGIGKADQPNFESFMPAYNESLGLVGSGGKYLTKWGNTAGLDMDKEIQALKTEMQGIWDKSN
jgi:multiple sugar transport system substrate-binding protein